MDALQSDGLSAATYRQDIRKCSISKLCRRDIAICRNISNGYHEQAKQAEHNERRCNG